MQRNGHPRHHPPDEIDDCSDDTSRNDPCHFLLFPGLAAYLDDLSELGRDVLTLATTRLIICKLIRSKTGLSFRGDASLPPMCV